MVVVCDLETDGDMNETVDEPDLLETQDTPQETLLQRAQDTHTRLESACKKWGLPIPGTCSHP